MQANQDYKSANGLDELRAVLETASEPLYYIRYQHGNQVAYIKVDMSKAPFIFWYYGTYPDVGPDDPNNSGGPVQKTIRGFLKEKYNDLNLREIGDIHE